MPLDDLVATLKARASEGFFSINTCVRSMVPSRPSLLFSFYNSGEVYDENVYIQTHMDDIGSINLNGN